jgi:hypothetical protein
MRDCLIIEWQEADGPTVKAPSRIGYGTSVINDLIPYELGGKVDFDYSRTGVRCRLEIPAKWMINARQPAESSKWVGSAQPIIRDNLLVGDHTASAATTRLVAVSEGS